MSSAAPSITLVVVAYNHAAQLPATLDALQALEYPVERREIVVVENGDGSSGTIARAYAGIRVLEPGRNLGFGGGCNLAVAHSSGEIIVLINPDLQPQPACVQALVAALGDQTVGVVGARLVYPDEHTIQHAGGYLQHPLLLAQHYGYGASAQGAYTTSRQVEFVTGAALAIRRATWDTLGGMDEAFYPAYYEDVDLCLRVKQHGFGVRYEASALAIHQEAAALGKSSLTYHRLYHLNRLRLLFKHFDDDWLLATWLPAELTHLRTTADDAEIAGLQAAYLHWQTVLLHGTSAANPLDTPPDYTPEHESELAWTLQQVSAKRAIVPLPFRSRLPLVARLRTLWNRIATETYLRPLIQQQNDYNAALAELGQALARQRRTTDAAILCQAMLLAKSLGRAAKTKPTIENTIKPQA